MSEEQKTEKRRAPAEDDSLAARLRSVAEVDKLRELLQVLGVDLPGGRGHDLRASVCDHEDATPGRFDQRGLLHVGARPPNAILEDTLLAAGEQLSALGRRELEVLGEGVLGLAQCVLPAVGQKP